MLSHRNILAAIQNIIEYVGYTSRDHEVVALPLSHSFGLNHVLCNLVVGGSAHIEHGFLRMKRIFKALESATGFPGTPTSYSMIFERYGSHFHNKAANLRFIVINSSPLPAEQAKNIMQILPKVNLMVYYGLTEASRTTFITHKLDNDYLLESVGKASPNVTLGILDEEGNQLKPYQSGRVCVRGETVMMGYWNRPKETENAFINGWMDTGDLGYIDDEGYLFLAGRSKDVINVGGLKLTPLEINEVYIKHEGIADFFTLGMRSLSGHQGEEIIGVVVPKANYKLSVEDLFTYGQRRLMNYKVPSQFCFVESIPRSSTGKVLRKDLETVIKSSLK